MINNNDNKTIKIILILAVAISIITFFGISITSTEALPINFDKYDSQEEINYISYPQQNSVDEFPTENDIETDNSKPNETTKTEIELQQKESDSKQVNEVDNKINSKPNTINLLLLHLLEQKKNHIENENIIKKVF